MAESLRSVSIPRLLHVGPALLSKVGALISGNGFDTTCVLVASGSGPSRGFAATISRGCRDGGLAVLEREGLGGELEQAAELAALVIKEQVSLIVAVGGGKVIDTAKLAAARTGTELVSVPTTMAHDGVSSPVASLTSKGQRLSYAASMPAGIVVDTAVVGTAPPRTLRAGVGDLLSTLTALLDWQLAATTGADRYDAYSGLIAESAARPALDLTDLTNQDEHEVLAKGLLLSGLAMAAAGTSRPCSGAEHLISHSLDRLLGPRAALHGEQVALGSLVAAAAHGSDLLEQLRVVFRRVGLPVTPEELGVSRQDMLLALRGAPATRPDRYTILNRVDLHGGLALDLLDQAFA
jgi:glycerol-1-phosphate dehydrogenase [NAD(P)+]